MLQVIKKPLVTEKNTTMSGHGVYSFEVDKKATKTDIKNAVEKFFQVKVSSVNTSVCRGRSKRSKFGTTRVKYWKKAMVKLVEGEKIALFEGAN